MKLRKILPIIGIAIFIYILVKLDISSIYHEIKNANFNIILVACFFVFLSLITQTLKWYVIARVQKTKVPFLKAFQIHLISMFYGTITPSRIGTVIRSDYLRKYNEGGYGKGLSNFVLEKVFDLISLAFLAAIFSFAFSKTMDYLFYFILIFIMLVSFLWLFMDKGRSRMILRIFYVKFIPKKFKKKLKDGFHAFYEDMPRKRNFILFFLFNIVNWVVLYSGIFYMGVAVGIDVSFFYYLAILPVSTLVAQLPISIGGLGTREATMIGLFSIIHIDATKVFSMAMISFFLGSIVPEIIGGFLSLRFKEENESKHNNSLQKN